MQLSANRRCFTSGHCQIIWKFFVTGEFIYMNNLSMELWETSFRQIWQWLSELAIFFALEFFENKLSHFYHVKQRQWPQLLKQTRAAFPCPYSDWQTGQSVCDTFGTQIFFCSVFSFRTESNSRFISRKSLRIVVRSYVCCATFFGWKHRRVCWKKIVKLFHPNG